MIDNNVSLTGVYPFYYISRVHVRLIIVIVGTVIQYHNVCLMAYYTGLLLVLDYLAAKLLPYVWSMRYTAGSAIVVDRAWCRFCHDSCSIRIRIRFVYDNNKRRRGGNRWLFGWMLPALNHRSCPMCTVYASNSFVHSINTIIIARTY